MGSDGVRGDDHARPRVIERRLRVPDAPGTLVGRPRLDQLLAALVADHRLVVVAATAGSGKTTAVAQAVRATPRPVAWLSVEHTDRAPGRLVTYLEAALARVVPGVDRVATRALLSGAPHAEAAGLLGDALPDRDVLMVLDDLERIEGQSAAWAVVEAFARYAPPSACVVLVSRREIPASVRAAAAPQHVATLREEHLSFTDDEAAEALAALGHGGVDHRDVVRSTGGWVTGVLFRAWQASEHVVGTGGEADPLNGYLAAHIMDALDPAERAFLVRTSVLDEVDVDRAAALGVDDAAAWLSRLRRVHLPAVWTASGRLRCHSRFREHLLDRLARHPAAERRAIDLAHGRLLVRDGADEDAVEALLRAGALDEARVVAERVVVGVVERLDVALATRWLDALPPDPERPSDLTTAALMLAIGRDDIRGATAIADGLERTGRRATFAAGSVRAAVLMGWAYLHMARTADVEEIVAVAEPGPEMKAVRYAAGILFDAVRASTGAPPPLAGGPLDALVRLADYAHGRLQRVVDATEERWATTVVTPNRVAALRALGRTEAALRLLDASPDDAAWRTWVAPELLMDAGRPEEARALLEVARPWADATGSLGYRSFVGIAEAKLALRHDRDPAAAVRTLDRLERLPRFRGLLMVAEMLDCWYGFALLLAGEDDAAHRRLRAAVDSMRSGDRIIELPTAAVYLAEAAWRSGDEAGADQAADLALEASRRQGSFHLLLQAFHDIPAALSRRLDAERGPDSEWHRLGRSIAAGIRTPAPSGAAVHLRDLGRPAILVDGREVRPRLAKTFELLAYLRVAAPSPVGRDELLDRLFGGRGDDSTRAHLRQAMHGLRQVLPGEDPVPGGPDGWTLAPSLIVTTDASVLLRDLALADTLDGQERFELLTSAIARGDIGDFLMGAGSPWAEERAQSVRARVESARADAAELAFGLGRLTTAAELARAVVRADPGRERTWRLLMRLAGALGDDDGVLRIYRDCDRALATIGVLPADSTRELVAALRR